jgi:hypothetical protein
MPPPLPPPPPLLRGAAGGLRRGGGTGGSRCVGRCAMRARLQHKASPEAGAASGARRTGPTIVRTAFQAPLGLQWVPTMPHCAHLGAPPALSMVLEAVPTVHRRAKSIRACHHAAAGSWASIPNRLARGAGRHGKKDGFEFDRA